MINTEASGTRAALLPSGGERRSFPRHASPSTAITVLRNTRHQANQRCQKEKDEEEPVSILARDCDIDAGAATPRFSGHSGTSGTLCGRSQPSRLIGLLSTIIVLFASQGALRLCARFALVLRVVFTPLGIYFAVTLATTVLACRLAGASAYRVVRARRVSLRPATTLKPFAIAAAAATYGARSG